MSIKYSSCLTFLFLMISSCSSLERAHYYNVSNVDHSSQPEISYTPETVLHHGYRQYVALTYKRQKRFLGKDNVQQIVIGANYFLNQLAAGPPLLPVIPLLGNSFEMNKKKNVEILLQVGATGPFYDKMDKLSLPDLIIVTKSKGAMKPIKVERFKFALRLTYDTTIEEAPEFLIRENVVRFGGETLKIPRLKFVFDNSLHYEWMAPIGG